MYLTYTQQLILYNVCRVFATTSPGLRYVLTYTHYVTVIASLFFATVPNHIQQHPLDVATISIYKYTIVTCKQSGRQRTVYSTDHRTRSRMAQPERRFHQTVALHCAGEIGVSSRI